MKYRNSQASRSPNLINSELERRVLGELLLDSEFAPELSEDDFTLPAHKSTIKAMQELKQNGRVIDISTLAGSGIDPVWLSGVLSGSPSAANIESNIRELKQLKNLRQLYQTSQKSLEMIEDGAVVDDVLMLWNTAQNQVESLGGEYYSMQDVAENIASEEVFERMKNTEFKTGFIDLDLNFHIHHEDLIIIAGRPSMGKTAFALGLAKNFALQQGEPVAFFSYEMSKEQLAVRLANSESAGDKSFLGFSRAVNKIKGMPLYMVDKPVSLMDARGIMRELSRKGVKHFFFDYLQIMPASHGENRTQELSHLTRTLKLYAKEFGCVNWVLSQLSRAVEARQDKRPSLADLRESGAIEQDADTVLFLYRPVYYGINSTDDIDNTNNLAQVLIRKQRNFKSPVDVNLFYRPETNYWENWGSPAKYPSLADLTEITEDESIPF